MLILAMIPIGAAHARPPTEDRQEEETVPVGRISHVEGQLWRYVPEEDDWVATVQDAPFGSDGYQENSAEPFSRKGTCRC
jgi:hypothetical protein